LGQKVARKNVVFILKVARKNVTLHKSRPKKCIKTLLNHPEKYHVDSALKLGKYNVGRQGPLLTLPLYMAFMLTDL